jgi:D-alanyl-D-alanine carboxypeptidase (penicillin-binding protein 5/6)
VKNINFLLGREGIIGIKTGNSNQAGGVFVAAADVNINARPTTIVTAVMGAPTLAAALDTSLLLIQSAEANFRPVSVIAAGAVIGRYRPPWAATLEARASQNLIADTWHGTTVAVTVTLRSVQANAHAGQAVGSLRVTATGPAAQPAVTVTLRTAPRRPSLWWRLSHP